MQSRIRLVLADDHGMVRKGIREYLETDPRMEIVGEATDGEQALEMARALTPDVVLLDVQMPKLNGIETARRIRAEKLPCAILMVSAYDDDPYVMSALQAGANGYVLKTTAPADLVNAVVTVRSGRLALDEGLIQVLARSPLADGRGGMPRAEVSAREREVLRLIAQGQTNKAIAARLDISDRTVQSHIANIFEKLSASSRTEAVMIGIRLGLIPQE
ncbi:MAG: response regulator transcription factor [Thermoflexales bacterium]